MRKVIGIGETVLDITFKDDQPIGAKPGGSVYNAMITLGRLGIQTEFISEVGRDRIGKMIKQFLADNGVGHQYVCDFDGGKTPLALAFLDEQLKADYLFYKDYPRQRLDYVMPKIEADDILIFGSYFALNPVLREKVVDILDEAKRKKAIIYYDVNFRKSHKEEVRFLMPNILENFEYADIVKGSDEDFENMYADTDVNHIFKEYIEFYCKNFVYTRGAQGVTYFSRSLAKDYEGKKVDVVSTVGAGDNFNAGMIYGLIANDVTYDELKAGLSPERADRIIKSAIDISANSCTSLDNYISTDFAHSYKTDYEK